MNRKKASSRGKFSIFHRYFTLIELLLVIAIIAILAGLLLPTLSRARDMAKTIICMGNCKTIGVAQNAYSADSDEWILPARNNCNAGSWCEMLWFGILSGCGMDSFSYGTEYPINDRYSTRNTFYCPNEIRAGSEDPFSFSCYISNYILSGEMRNGKYMRKQSALSVASNAIFAMDSIRTDTYSSINRNSVSYRHGIYDNRPFLKSEAETLVSGEVSRGRANTLFMDGHVETHTFSSLSLLRKNAQESGISDGNPMLNNCMFYRGFYNAKKTILTIPATK